MIVEEAKEVARQWVMEEGRHTPSFRGAYYAGSTNLLPAEAALPSSSDVDVTVVLSGPDLPGKPGILPYRGVLLDVSYAPMDRLQSPERILGDYHLAGAFRTQNIILDPSGRLTELQAVVSRDFARRQWVYKRCEQARDKVLRYLEPLSEPAPLHDHFASWLFAAGITTHVLLVAGLRNPTVRRRYLATPELLAEYGRLDFYEILLETLGCAGMTRDRAEQHLAALEEAFDAAKAVVKTRFFFASEISDIARPISIGGSRDLVERGCHREAVFWIAATYSRCQTILHHDAPAEMRDTFSPGYQQLLADLGINSLADLHRRGEQVKSLLPRVWEVAQSILSANPEIKD